MRRVPDRQERLALLFVVVGGTIVFAPLAWVLQCWSGAVAHDPMGLRWAPLPGPVLPLFLLARVVPAPGFLQLVRATDSLLPQAFFVLLRAPPLPAFEVALAVTVRHRVFLCGGGGGCPYRPRPSVACPHPVRSCSTGHPFRLRRFHNYKLQLHHTAGRRFDLRLVS